MAEIPGLQLRVRTGFTFRRGLVFMRLEVEKKEPTDNVGDSVVKAAILALRSFGPSSFASLTDEHGNYLQVAGGGVTCMLERRDALTGRHYRAYGGVPSKVFPDGTILMFGGGSLTLRSDEWLTAQTVTKVFLAFREANLYHRFVKDCPTPARARKSVQQLGKADPGDLCRLRQQAECRF